MKFSLTSSQIALYNRKDLIETHVKPGTLELQSRLLDDCAELTEQVEKQSERLIELRAKRDANPGMSLPSHRRSD